MLKPSIHRILQPFVLCLLMGSGGEAAAQSLYQYDSLTYQQYVSGEHRALQRTGRAALRAGRDFYYLRMRLGISQYNRKNYEAALPHFRAAQGMNPADTLLQEYLYYSYLWTNRRAEADLQAEQFRSPLQQKIGYQRQFLRSISLSTGYLWNSNFVHQGSADLLNGRSGMAQASVNGGIFYANIGMELALSPRLQLGLSGSFFQTQRRNIVQVPIDRLATDVRSSHGQANAVARYQLGKGWDMQFGLGYYQMTTTNSRLTPPPPQLQTMSAPLHSFLGSWTIGKRWSHLRFEGGFSASNLSDTLQLQTEWGLTYFPLGNTHLYGRTALAGIYNGGRQQLVVSQVIGGRIADWLWYEAQGSFGNHQNYATAGGLLAYNTFDPVRITAGADLRFTFRRFEWRLGYQWQQRQGSILYNSDPANSAQFQRSNYFYSNHLLKTQLVWKF